MEIITAETTSLVPGNVILYLERWVHVTTLPKPLKNWRGTIAGYLVRVLDQDLPVLLGFNVKLRKDNP